ncbi:TadG family pilus assembly protein [Ralstonia sp. R-29]|uniref:TadG family pilus assembly protein n=1 Tax=Ralstonia sp. R-29 TaxID=3404059 RepID=UPI003CE951DC
MHRSAARLRHYAVLRRRAQGAISVMTAVFVTTIGLAVLVSVDIGNLFYSQRALQRAADLAAMAAVQQLGAANNAAQQSVNQNGLSITPTVQVGFWDNVSGTPPTYFTPQAAMDGTTNAAKVTLTENVPYFFTVGQRNLTATAIAANTSIVSFSLGSGLAATDANRNQALGLLLGGSVNLVSYSGLANANIRLGDLAVAFGAGSVKELLSLNASAKTLQSFIQTVLSLANISGVTVGVMPASGSAASNQILINNGLINQSVDLVARTSSVGILNVLQGDSVAQADFLSQPSNEQAAADTTVNALDLIMAAAQIANGNSAVNVPALAINAPGVGTVNVSLKVIEPPVIAIGPAGKDASGNWRTQAKTAQVRVGLGVNVSAAGLLSMNLPIGLLVASAQAGAKKNTCAVPRSQSTATISVLPQPVSVCLAQGADTAVNSMTACASASPAPVASVTVPLVTTVTVGLKANVVPLSNTSWTDETIAVSQIGKSPQTDVNGNAPPRVSTCAVGQSACTNLGGLLGGLQPSISTYPSTPLTGVVNAVLAPVLALLTSTLSLIGPLLDTVIINTVGPLLNAIGLDIGYADVALRSLDCDAADLVY